MYDQTTLNQFISRLEQASSESEIQQACQCIKEAVQERWVNENTRRKPMSEIRKKVKERFPAIAGKAAQKGNVPFPYFFTDSGKGRIARWEHLAIKHLKEEWNLKEKPELEVTAKPEDTSVVKDELDILSQVGLSDGELKIVKAVIGEADVREWLKQAILQRANSINALRERLDEDLTEVPSDVLMFDKKYRTNPTAARELVSRAVRVAKQWNHEHPDQKWCITNKLISELTGVTVKAIAKAVEGMDLESYNKSHNLTPVVNRLIKASIGEASQLMSISQVTGIEGTETNYHLPKAS